MIDPSKKQYDVANIEIDDEVAIYFSVNRVNFVDSENDFFNISSRMSNNYFQHKNEILFDFKLINMDNVVVLIKY